MATTPWANLYDAHLNNSNRVLTAALAPRMLSELKNSCFSPLSVQAALTLLLSGARTDTWTELSTVLGLKTLKPGDLGDQYRRFNDALTERNHAAVSEKSAIFKLAHHVSAEKSAIFSIANGMWLSNRIASQKFFTAQAEELFDATVREVDFRSDWAVADINTWVTQKTNGKITSAIDALPPECLMVLVNAVYFLCSWSHTFHDYKTREQKFFTASGAMRLVPTMNDSSERHYLETEDVQAVALPYTDNRFCMFIILPKPGKPMLSVAEFVSKPGWWKEFGTSRVNLSLPRFSFSSSHVLDSYLRELGLGRLFAQSADFSGIVQPPHQIAVDSVVHKTFVKVNETGTEAAAVTGMSVASCVAIEDTPEVRMEVNRPFGFALMNMPTETALFVGSVCDPIES